MRAHFYLLDALKFLAIVLIVLRHAQLGAGITPQSGGLIGLQHAYLGCEFFFMVSGFFLAAHICTRASADEDTLCYLWGKYRRFLPTHALCLLLLTWAALGCPANPLAPFMAFYYNSELLFELTLTHRLGATDFILNNPDWFLSALLFACALTHLTLAPCVRRGEAALRVYRAAALCLALCIYMAILRYKGMLSTFNDPLPGLPDLCCLRGLAGVLAGSALYLYLGSVNHTAQLKPAKATEWRSSLLEAAALLIFLAALLMPAPGRAADFCSALALLSTLAFAVRSGDSGLLSRLCALPPLRLLWRLQLPLYLCHWALTHYHTRLPLLKGLPWSLPLCLALSLVLSALIYALTRLIRLTPPHHKYPTN